MMISRTAGLVVAVAAVFVVAVVGVLLLLRDSSPREAETQNVQLSRERKSLGMFPQDEAIERAGEMVGFNIRLPLDPPGSVQLTAVQASTGEAPIGVGPRYATLWYDVSLPGADEPGKISVQQYADVPGPKVGDEWETETLPVGSLTVTVYSKTDELAIALFVVRLPGTDEAFDVTAPLALRDQGLALARAFVAAYEAAR
jgi:hypothetical protein